MALCEVYCAPTVGNSTDSASSKAGLSAGGAACKGVLARATALGVGRASLPRAMQWLPRAMGSKIEVRKVAGLGGGRSLGTLCPGAPARQGLLIMRRSMGDAMGDELQLRAGKRSLACIRDQLMKSRTQAVTLPLARSLGLLPGCQVSSPAAARHWVLIEARGCAPARVGRITSMR